MAKDRGNHTQQNMDQTLNGMMSTVRKSADVFGHQASRIRETSAALAEQTMGNAAELGNRLTRSKDPLEWVEAHSEFLSKQAQAMAAGAQGIGKAFVNGSNEAAKCGPLSGTRSVTQEVTRYTIYASPQG